MHKYSNFKIEEKDDVIFKGKNSIFATRLSELVENDVRSLEGLSFKLNFSRPTLWKYCEGSSIPNTKRLLNIARYFNVTPDYLLGVSYVEDSYIGLSPDSINQLKIWSEDELTNKFNDIFDLLISKDSSKALHDNLHSLLIALENYKQLQSYEEAFNQMAFFENDGQILYGWKSKEETISESREKISNYAFRVVKEFSNSLERYINAELDEDIFSK